MRCIWAVARQTLAQCLRSRIGIVFIVLVAAALVAAPMIARQDGAPLASQIRTFLAYSFSWVFLLLAVVTILLAAHCVASDVRSKQIFMLAAKPLARWQYIVGRWLGVVLLDAILLAVCGAGIYAVATHMKSGQTLNSLDRRVLATEVFAAREKFAPDAASFNSDLLKGIEREIQQLNEQGRLEAAIEGFRQKAGGDMVKARNLLAADIEKRLLQRMQSTPPGYQMAWLFKGIRLHDEPLPAEGKLLEIDAEGRQLLIRTPSGFTDRLLVGGPITVNGMWAVARDCGADTVVVWFDENDFRSPAVANLRAGDSMRMLAEPTLQLSYKPQPGVEPPDRTPLLSLWQFEAVDAAGAAVGRRYTVQQADQSGKPCVIVIPARALGPGGDMRVRYLNVPNVERNFATTVTILNSEISLLCRASSFEASMGRGLTEMLIAMMFLAALGVLAGSFLSFPVASLLSLALAPMTMVRDFLAESMGVGGASPSMAAWLYVPLSIVLPNLQRLMPSDRLVDGLNIGWSALAADGAWALASTAVALAIACLIFWRRELARVQV
jgi:ABC-type transport system involved in multi-copper enzyme maturation permease subunit